MDLDFYANLRDDSLITVGEVEPPLLSGNAQNQAEDTPEGIESEYSIENEQLGQSDEWSNIVDDYKSKLTDVVDDLYPDCKVETRLSCQE